MSVTDTAKIALDLVKKGVTVGLEEKIMQLREEGLELQEENLRLRKENRELKERLESEEDVYFRRRVYWRDGDDVPFCPYCRETSGILVHLKRPFKEKNVEVHACEKCRTQYATRGDAEFGVWRRPVREDKR